MHYFLESARNWVPVTPQNEAAAFKVPLDHQVFADTFDEIKVAIQRRDPEARIAVPEGAHTGTLSEVEVEALRTRILGVVSSPLERDSVQRQLADVERVHSNFEHTSLVGAVRGVSVDVDEAWLPRTFLLSKSWLGSPSLTFSGAHYDQYHQTLKRSRTSVAIDFQNPSQFASALVPHLPVGYEAIGVVEGPMGQAERFSANVPFILEQSGTPLFTYGVAIIPPTEAFERVFRHTLKSIDEHAHLQREDCYSLYYSGGIRMVGYTYGFDHKLWMGVRSLLGFCFRGGYGDYMHGVRQLDLEHVAGRLFSNIAQGSYGDYHPEVTLDRWRPGLKQWNPKKDGVLQSRTRLTPQNARELAQKLVRLFARSAKFKRGFLQPLNDRVPVSIDFVRGSAYALEQWDDFLLNLMEIGVKVPFLRAVKTCFPQFVSRSDVEQFQRHLYLREFSDEEAPLKETVYRHNHLLRCLGWYGLYRYFEPRRPLFLFDPPAKSVRSLFKEYVHLQGYAELTWKELRDRIDGQLLAFRTELTRWFPEQADELRAFCNFYRRLAAKTFHHFKHGPRS